MKTWYISFFISLLLLAIPGGGSAFVKESPAQSPEELDVYLCIGQSNMAGRGTLLPELTGTLEGVYLLNDRGEFEPAGNPLNKYSTIRKDLSMQALSPAYSFARKMAALSPRPVGLVVNARGGSSIDSWLKGSKDGYYEAALERVRLHPSELRRILRVGVPIALQEATVQLSFLVINMVVNGMGLMPSAGYGVAQKVVSVIMLVPSSIMQSVSAFVALGFEHCVANLYFLPLSMVLSASGYVVEGIDPALFTWANVAKNLTAATLGNTVAGVTLAMLYRAACAKR